MNRMKNIKYALLMICLLPLTSCLDLDIPPKNILLEENIYNEGGIEAYMAGLYNHLPMEDYNVSSLGDYGGYYYYHSAFWPMTSTGETVNHNQTGMYLHQTKYWQQGYEVIRNANRLIEGLPESGIDKTDHFTGEAKFIRAYVYFALVKRYGGMPLVKEVQDYDGEASELWVPRSSHKENYDFMLEDLDEAIRLMDAKSVGGRANKYVAAAFKTRVALFAGSIARYGGVAAFEKDGVMLCGIPQNYANDYFKQAWEAAKMVEEGGFALYKNDADLEKNFENVFAKAESSPESVFIRNYEFGVYKHCFDAIYSPPRMATEWGSRYCLTLDWVELFNGLPIDPNTGHLKVTDDEGNYIVYKSAGEIFENAEPRLRACMMIPGRTYKNVELDIRRGLIDESIDPSTKIKKFIPDDGNSTSAYTNNEFFKQYVITNTQNVLAQTPHVTSKGIKLNINGLDGPDNGGSRNTQTGFHGRKWLDMSLTQSTTRYGESYSPWIDIRYAEVLLSRAEAALELFQGGVPAMNNTDMQQDAFNCINAIRERAGAEPVNNVSDLSEAPAVSKNEGPGGFIWAPNKGQQIIRIERYKELAFEHKLFWDLRRWFSFDKQIYNYRRRMLNPFMFLKDVKLNDAGNPVGKYILDARVSEMANNNLTYPVKAYYDPIPGDQIKSNPLLEQNKDY